MIDSKHEPVRIGIVADVLAHTRMGMERYADSYLRHLPSGGTEFVGVFVGDVVEKPYFDEVVALSEVSDGFLTPLLTVWSHVRSVNDADLDLLHCPTQNTPPYFWFVDPPRVLTIHGAAEFELDADEHRQPSRKKIYTYRLLKRRLTHVITPSHSSKHEVVRHYGFERDRVTPIHHGISESFRPVDKRVATKTASKYGLPTAFLLAVGRTQPKKNIPNLLQGYDRFRDAGHGLPLVLVGGESWGHDEVHRVLDNHDLHSAVTFAPYIETADLPAIYSAAKLTCYPSLHEGFGFPILESMACGTPVITSDCYSMPEVGGDAVVLVDPRDPTDIGDKLIQLCTDSDRRARLIEAGLDRAAQFTWERSGRLHGQTFRRVLDQK